MQTMNVKVTEELAVNVIPNENYEYLMTTREVAKGYGTSIYVVRMAMNRHSSELIESKHFVKGVTIGDTPSEKGITKSCPLGKNAQPHQIFWTKRGIVRLGFFIKSERAKLFRDWAEELIIKIDEQRDLFGAIVPQKSLPKKRNHNRLTQERIISILADVAKIEDKELRLSLIQKLGV